MFFDLSKSIERERFKRKANEFYKAGKLVELKTKAQRTPRQNRYLHLLLSYYGMETGNTVEYVKAYYFKRLCNPDLFIVVKEDPYLGRVEDLRSSKDLSTAEMTTAIDRLRHWSDTECGIYLPEPDDLGFLTEIEIEMDRHKEFL